MDTQLNFFNTTNLKNPELKSAISDAMSQDDRILEYFKLHPNNGFTPAEIASLTSLHPNTPITSVRRSITVLTKKGCLEKTDIQKPGMYGKPNYCWRLINPII